MKKRPRILLAGVAALGICVLTTATLKSQPATLSGFGSPVHWINVNAGAVSRDTKILDAIIRDAVTNQELASVREFYGGVSNRTVRYVGFPTNYLPMVDGYRFQLLSSNVVPGLQLTLAFGGMWVDQPMPQNAKSRFQLLGPSDLSDQGVLLFIYNSGGWTTNNSGDLVDTIGVCTLGYGILQTSDVWKVGLLGGFDP